MTTPAERLTQALAPHRHGQLDDAARLYQAFLRDHPRHFEALHLLATAALQARQTERGVALAREAIAVAPRAGPAHVTLGNGLRELGRPADALACYDTAIELNAADGRAWYNRANALLDLRRAREAAACYEKAIFLQKGSPEAANGLGNAQSTLRRHDDALASFDKAIALRPYFAIACTTAATPCWN